MNSFDFCGASAVATRTAATGIGSAKQLQVHNLCQKGPRLLCFVLSERLLAVEKIGDLDSLDLLEKPQCEYARRSVVRIRKHWRSSHDGAICPLHIFHLKVGSFRQYFKHLLEQAKWPEVVVHEELVTGFVLQTMLRINAVSASAIVLLSTEIPQAGIRVVLLLLDPSVTGLSFVPWTPG